MSNPDLSHLNVLEIKLSHERARLANAKTSREKERRTVWVSQLEKEVAGEKKFLGLIESKETEQYKNLTDAELLAVLFSD